MTQNDILKISQAVALRIAEGIAPQIKAYLDQQTAEMLPQEDTPIPTKKGKKPRQQ